MQSARIDINEILKDESRAASTLSIGRVRKSLVVLEIAVHARCATRVDPVAALRSK